MAEGAELLRTWEHGQGLPPAARLLHLAGENTADLPVGAAVAALLARHRAWFGPTLRGVADCPQCNTRLEIACDVDELLRTPVPGPGVHSVAADGHRVQFRLPTVADLIAVESGLDEDVAALGLLDRCLVDAKADAALLAPVSERMAEIDPLGDAELALQCESCGAQFARGLDAGEFLWREIETRALRLLGHVHALARAYGWREADILAMSPTRRQVYLDLVGA
ncbi:MAG TPA: hypothetical protein VFE41_17830 [Acetobacteraceae bacterium]|jgi:hypothetical protein|nr:hypothetical protein [Acetobacteraceae bacterium]